ncbi:MAG TPA: helix-turn-helix domain-containing protein [Acidimicrobiales bacterium]|nr:helix-turn-helix domain-containing protein [Acidimicrobiales bacterium]
MSTLPTAELILVAARRCVSERGPGKLTLSAVAAEAGVSRPTLYHWFPNKARLLGALSAYEVEQFDLGLQAVAGAHRSPNRRLDATLRYLVTYLDESMGPDPIGADPTFALQSLADSLGPHVESLARVLGDALDELPTVRAGALSGEQAAEMFLRVAYSHYLVPHRDPEALLITLRSFAGLTGRTVERATA